MKLRGSESALSGAGAGVVSAIVTCPLDLVKTKLQAEGGLQGDNPRYKGLVGTLKKIFREEGFRGCYRGLGPTLFGYAPTWGIYFATYDAVKQYMVEKRHSKPFRASTAFDFFYRMNKPITAVCG
jgi:solute carrier family 25 folate transporter 32